MSIFGDIMDKIFHHGAPQASPTPSPTSVPPQAAEPPAATPAAAPSQVAPSAPPASPVDVEAVLSAMAAGKGGGGNWQTSIVDLLKLLDLDPSLSARKELANELNVHVSEDGTAEENIALHRAVMDKLEENGGRVPESLKG